MWTLTKRQQQCGAQLPETDGKRRKRGEAPKVAVADRPAQDNDRAAELYEDERGEEPEATVGHLGED
ncbi:MAG: hypothetical protein ABIT16_03995 [Croceibacterium sp.]